MITQLQIERYAESKRGTCLEVFSSIVNQFVDENEALRLAAEFTATLKELSGLP